VDFPKNLASGTAMELLCSQRLRTELNHLLWIQPFDNRGTWDFGWSCRDHAFIAGILAQLLGLTVKLIHGEALFVRAATGDASGNGLHQKNHTWLSVEGDGLMDLSIRLSSQGAASGRVGIEYVAASQCRPSGNLLIAETEDDFKSALLAAPCLPGEHAIYRADRTEIIDQQLAYNAFAVIHSPLTVRLSAKYPPSLYAKLAVHSFELLRGNAVSLASHQQDYAWKKIARLNDDAIPWLALNGGLR